MAVHDSHIEQYQHYIYHLFQTYRQVCQFINKLLNDDEL